MPAYRLALLGLLLAAVPAPAADKLQYNRDVRPILAENCFACHGPDGAARKADLRLDQREKAVAAGAVTPGDPAASAAVERIFLAADDGELMPPAKSHKSLTAEQKAVLKRWVAEGAEYQPHWAFIPPSRPTVPVVNDAKWVRTPIDAFILAELEKRNLAPAPEADRRTLARRLSLDLVGLPPDPADVEAFVADQSPGYYEKYVEKLMASPHWGEHRGRYWLDAARYADTHGIHFDNYRENWAYRDWVIRAFNENKPFNEFTREQLAGDLLPNPTLDQLVATGFNRCNITTNEGGAISEEYLVLYTRDRTETAAQVFLGLTAGCAVCHDHKFDPLSAKEFYSLAAFFNNTTQAAMDGNIPNTPLTVPVPRPEDRPRFVQLGKELAAAKAKVAARKAAARGDFGKWLATATPADVAAGVPNDRLSLHAPLTRGLGDAVAVTAGGRTRLVSPGPGYAWTATRAGAKALKVQAGKPIAVPEAGDFDKDQPFAASAWVQVPAAGATGAVAARMDDAGGYRGWDFWLQGNKAGMHIIHDWPTDALKVVSKTPLKPGQWTHVTVTYDGSAKPAGVKVYYNGEPQPTETETNTLQGTTRTPAPLTIGQRRTGSRLAGVAVQDLRVYARPISGLDAKRLAGVRRTADLLAKPADKRTPAEADELFAWWLANRDPVSQTLSAALAGLLAEETAIKARGTVAHVMNERPAPAEAYVLFRGDYDKRRDKVGPDTPKVLPGFAPGLPRNRLGLADWLVRPDHPLTARVTVNRFWQELFGTGLVRTAGDFGTTGELPTHPDLLDWLAVDFRDHWDTKRFFKLLVTSAAYRQSAATTPDKLRRDPDDRLLSRGPRFRMDAEMVRDYALAAGGLLVDRVGGASARPYQPDGVWEAVAMPGSDTRDYRRDRGDNLYRRSLYTFWKRAAPPASMEVLNAPNRETCAVRRDRTNTPLQALLTLNDVQFVEAARVLAEKTLRAGGPTDEAKLQYLAGRVLARPFRPEELTVVKRSLAELTADYRAKPMEATKLLGFGEAKADPGLDPATLAAWAMVCNEVLNLDEVLNK